MEKSPAQAGFSLGSCGPRLVPCPGYVPKHGGTFRIPPYRLKRSQRASGSRIDPELCGERRCAVGSQAAEQVIDDVLLAGLSECEAVDGERVAQAIEAVELVAEGRASTGARWRRTAWAATAAASPGEADREVAQQADRADEQRDRPAARRSGRAGPKAGRHAQRRARSVCRRTVSPVEVSDLHRRGPRSGFA